jgi:hypothetical protein
VVSSSKTIAKVPSLTKGKKYYVRIRAYKSYKNASGKTVKYYSDWSGKKSITVK